MSKKSEVSMLRNVESVVLSAGGVAGLQGEVVFHRPVLGEQPRGLVTSASGCNDDDVTPSRDLEHSFLLQLTWHDEN